MVDPFEVLEREHAAIGRVLKALEAATPNTADVAFFRAVVDFVREFADGSHHRKEEDHLFPALERRGIQRHMGPIGVMLHEHEEGREHAREMDRLIAAADLPKLCVRGRAYAALMRGHILKEEQALFMMGRSVLSAAEQAEVARGFATVGEREGVREPALRAADAVLARAGMRTSG
jgi:hemerythrin-like domain-containing protein